MLEWVAGMGAKVGEEGVRPTVDPHLLSWGKEHARLTGRAGVFPLDLWVHGRPYT